MPCLHETPVLWPYKLSGEQGDLHAGPVYLNGDQNGDRATSSDTHRRVDAEVTKMLREAYSRVTALLVRVAMHISCLPINLFC